jgi:hypothetical protein
VNVDKSDKFNFIRLSIKRERQAGGVSQMVQHLPSNREVIEFNPQYHLKKGKEEEAAAQGLRKLEKEKCDSFRRQFDCIEEYLESWKAFSLGVSVRVFLRRD